MSRVAVLGLGAMGLPVARRLVATGHQVRGWNRSPDRPGLGTSGLDLAPSAALAVDGAEFVLTVLADDRALTGTFADGLGDALTEGQDVLNLGTVAASTVRGLAATLAQRGVGMADVGMLGNSTHAGQGELRLYVGGTEGRLERIRPLLQDIGKEVSLVGPLGAGMDLKLVLNLLMGLEMQALAEVSALGAGLGLDRAAVLEAVVSSGFSAPVMGFKSHRMSAGRYGAPDFRLALMAKDLRLAVNAARASGSPLPMGAAAQQAHAAAVAAGWGELDCAGIADALGADAPTTAHRAPGGRPVAAAPGAAAGGPGAGGAG